MKLKFRSIMLTAFAAAAMVAAPFASLTPTASAATTPVPVYRLANFITHERLFTLDAAERDNAVNHLAGWVSEGVAYDASATTDAGLTPVYRLANWKSHERLFTTSAAERDNAVQHLDGWVSEGIAYYASPTGTPSLLPVYRLANFITHERLFTTSAPERDNAVQHLAGWVSEGIAFYVNPSTPGAGSGPIGTCKAATAAPVTGANLVLNPGVETGNATSTGPANFTFGTDNATTTATSAYASTGHAGSRSLVASVTAASGTYPGAQWATDPIAVTGGTQYLFSDYYQSNVDTEIDAEYTNTAGVTNFLAVVAKTPASSTWAQAKGTINLPADAKTVTVYHVLSTVGTLSTDDYSLTAYSPVGFNRSLVSFTFDDAWKNIVTNGLPVLNQYGVKSTQYLLTGPTIANDPDYMTLADMLSLKAAGQEIASHTINHNDSTTLTTAQLDTELSDSKTWLQANLGVTVDDFATPYGAYNSSVLTEIGKYYTYHRSTDEGYNSKDNLNCMNIKVQNILSTTTTAQVQAWIDQAAKDKTWLVLVYHQVTPTAPTSTDTDPTTGAVVPDVYWTTPADLGTELNYAKTHSTTATVKEAVTELQAQL